VWIFFSSTRYQNGQLHAAAETDGFTQKQHLPLDIARVKVLTFSLLKLRGLSQTERSHHSSFLFYLSATKMNGRTAVSKVSDFI
jgi:hypothetical protein